MSVVRDQLQRLGHIDPDSLGLPIAAEAVDTSGLRWRTRMRLAVRRDGIAGLRRHGSHDLVAIDDCLIAHESLHIDELLSRTWPNADELTVAASPDTGERVVTTGSRQKSPLVFSAAGRQWQVSGGFWQSHYAAGETLASAVLDAAAVQPGSHVVDLYAGVGLFGGSLASAGPARIDVVEGDRSAADDAAVNLADIPEARVHATAVEKYLREHAAITPDVVVLDPPRRGGRRQVVEPIAAWRPRAVVYVACDPAALARDIAAFAERGYRLAGLRVFDLFPMTHHIECVALLSPGLSPAEG